MFFTVTSDLLIATQHTSLDEYRQRAQKVNSDHYSRDIKINLHGLPPEALDDLVRAARSVADNKTARALESLILARAGRFDKPIPNFKAFRGVLEAFLKADAIDGWLYVEKQDGKLYPALVTAVQETSKNDELFVSIAVTFYGFFPGDGYHRGGYGLQKTSYQFEPGDVANRRLPDILAASGLHKETPALRETYWADMKRHDLLVRDEFSKQFRCSGPAYYFEKNNYSQIANSVLWHRVIHDLNAEDYGAKPLFSESYIFEQNLDSKGCGKIPEHPVVRVFDLRTHEFFWISGAHLTPYAYDKSLGEKIVLPPSHRDLLDVLTHDLDAFVGDIVEGKSAGNVVLCKGIPGVGKTLTAEVYAELIEKPLYSIHSGELGTTASTIEGNLKTIFQRAKRWNCVLLLDEADVFVVRRGNNIEQNAIVAEFLRTLEYFDGLLFMTTNRPDDIDEAIVSRCAALIDYTPPSPDGAAAIWRVMAAQHQVDLSDTLIEQLIATFPQIAPRDIKMLLRLALRVALAHEEPLSLDVFRRCALFRAIKMEVTS